jgi:hypothetical protein
MIQNLSSSDGAGFWTLAGIGAAVVGTCAGRCHQEKNLQ